MAKNHGHCRGPCKVSTMWTGKQGYGLLLIPMQQWKFAHIIKVFIKFESIFH